VILGKRLYNDACKSLMRAIVELGAGNRETAIGHINEAIGSARAWSNEIEEDITRRHLEQHAQQEVHRG
jgi:hypothetical protein